MSPLFLFVYIQVSQTTKSFTYIKKMNTEKVPPSPFSAIFLTNFSPQFFPFKRLVKESKSFECIERIFKYLISKFSISKCFKIRSLKLSFFFQVQRIHQTPHPPWPHLTTCPPQLQARRSPQVHDFCPPCQVHQQPLQQFEVNTKDQHIPTGCFPMPPQEVLHCSLYGLHHLHSITIHFWPPWPQIQLECGGLCSNLEGPHLMAFYKTILHSN